MTSRTLPWSDSLRAQHSHKGIAEWIEIIDNCFDTKHSLWHQVTRSNSISPRCDCQMANGKPFDYDRVDLRPNHESHFRASQFFLSFLLSHRFRWFATRSLAPVVRDEQSESFWNAISSDRTQQVDVAVTCPSPQPTQVDSHRTRLSRVRKTGIAIGRPWCWRTASPLGFIHDAVRVVFIRRLSFSSAMQDCSMTEQNPSRMASSIGYMSNINAPGWPMLIISEWLIQNKSLIKISIKFNFIIELAFYENLIAAFKRDYRQINRWLPWSIWMNLPANQQLVSPKRGRKNPSSGVFGKLSKMVAILTMINGTPQA